MFRVVAWRTGSNQGARSLISTKKTDEAPPLMQQRLFFCFILALSFFVNPLRALASVCCCSFSAFIVFSCLSICFSLSRWSRKPVTASFPTFFSLHGACCCCQRACAHEGVHQQHAVPSHSSGRGVKQLSHAFVRQSRLPSHRHATAHHPDSDLRLDVGEQRRCHPICVLLSITSDLPSVPPVVRLSLFPGLCTADREPTTHLAQPLVALPCDRSRLPSPVHAHTPLRLARRHAGPSQTRNTKAKQVHFLGDSLSLTSSPTHRNNPASLSVVSAAVHATAAHTPWPFLTRPHPRRPENKS